jgi:phage terminase small subunit
MGKRLSDEDKRRRFVEEFVVDLNATAAAKRAGYSARSAGMQGSRLMKIDEIRSAIQKKIDARSQRIELSADAVLRELARIAQCDISEAFDDDGSLKPLKEIPVDVRRVIAGVETIEHVIPGSGEGEEGAPIVVKTKKLKFWSKNEALQTLARHFKLLTDRVEVHDTRGLADRIRKARERRKS